MSIKCWKVEGALHSPKGITSNSKVPYFVMNAVFSFEALSNSTCQNPLAKSSEENYCEPDNISSISSMCGSG